MENQPLLQEPGMENQPVLQEPGMENVPLLQEPGMENVPLLQEPGMESEPVLRKPGLYPELKRRWPCLYTLMTSRPDQFRLFKFMIGIGYGLLLGIGLHYAVIMTLNLPEVLRAILAVMFTVALALGCAISVQMRCIFSLVIPTVLGKNGRAYLWAYLIAILIRGPLSNILSNAGEVSRSLSCSARLAQNQSRERMELIFNPIKEIIKELQDEAVNIQDITALVKENFKPVAEEVLDQTEINAIKPTLMKTDTEEGVDRVSAIDKRHDTNVQEPAKQSEAKFGRKLDYKCEEVFSMGIEMCKEKLTELHEKCKDKVKIMHALLCWPFQIKVLCNLVSILPKLTGINCDSMEAVNPGFGDAYVEAQQASDELDKGFEVNMQYKVVDGEQAVHRKTAKDVILAVSHKFDGTRVWFDEVSSFITKLLGFLFIIHIYSAYQYHKKYILEFDHDNKYINNYFLYLDERRRIQGKRTLLPLKSLEKKEFITASSRFKLSGDERSKFIKSTINLIVRAISLTMVVLADKIIFEILELIRRHSRIEFRLQGSHHIKAIVYGEGFMGKLFKSMLDGFNKNHTIDSSTSNYECLPHATLTDTKFVKQMAYMLLGLWLLMLVEAYGLRLRHIVAAFFYPRRDKRRTLYLYNDILKRRNGFLKHARGVVKESAREQKLSDKVGALVGLRLRFPSVCGFLKICAKRTCLICKEKERPSFIRCDCNFFYCPECWFDIEGMCYVCRADDGSLVDSDEEMLQQIQAAQIYDPTYDLYPDEYYEYYENEDDAYYNNEDDYYYDYENDVYIDPKTGEPVDFAQEDGIDTQDGLKNNHDYNPYEMEQNTGNQEPSVNTGNKEPSGNTGDQEPPLMTF